MRLKPLLAAAALLGTFSFLGHANATSAQVDPLTNGPVMAAQSTSVSSGTQSATAGVFSVSIVGTCPGPVTLTLSGATPGAQVGIGWSANTGSFTIPSGPCAGTVLGLDSPNLLAIVTADAFGMATVAGTAPAAACGASVQAVDFSNCGTSNIGTVPGGGGTSFTFPSAGSAVVGSVGFVDTSSVGYFWSANRGDSVTESFAGPASVSSYTFDCNIPINFLNNGNTVDWNVIINGTVVDSFSVSELSTGVSVGGSFPAIAGPNYTVSLAVTNEVPGDGGSTTWRYAGIGNNTLTLN